MYEKKSYLTSISLFDFAIFNYLWAGNGLLMTKQEGKKKEKMVVSHDFNLAKGFQNL